MSGIVGIINLDGRPVDRQLLWRMTEVMASRGPDEQQIWIDGNVGFGHTLFRTTVEAETEKQPLTLDNKVWLTADARIDGRTELISALEGKLDRDIRAPQTLRKPNDAELILYAYEAWGEDCVQHLIGDFAFAIWDNPKRRLFCARDHSGVRQLFYFFDSQSLVFSNTLNSLRLYPRVSNKLNDTVIGDFLLFSFNQSPINTIFADIERLPSGRRLTLSNGALKTTQYWTPRASSIQFKKESEYIEAFKELFRSAVDDRLRTAQVSVSMSGGMDSSAVAALAHRGLQQSSAPFDLRAFCVVYDRSFADPERDYATVVARALRLPIEYLEGDAINANDSRGARAFLRPQPFQVDPFYAVTDSLLGRMSAHGRVALTGWDGDTILNESPRYLYSTLLKQLRVGQLAANLVRYAAWTRKPPPIGLRTSLKRIFGRYPKSAPFPEWLNPEFVRAQNLVERWRDINSEPRVFHSIRPNAFRILSSPNWGALFERYDSGVTSLPLEVRHPLADVRVIEYALGLPVIPWVIDKQILRASMQDMLPRSICVRPKSPLNFEPAVALIGSEKFKQVDEFSPTPTIHAYIDRQAVPKITSEENSVRLWMNARPFILNQWLLHSLPINKNQSPEKSENDCQIKDRRFG